MNTTGNKKKMYTYLTRIPG